MEEDDLVNMYRAEAEKSIKHRKLFYQSRKKLRAKISIDET